MILHVRFLDKSVCFVLLRSYIHRNLLEMSICYYNNWKHSVPISAESRLLTHELGCVLEANINIRQY